MSDRSRRRAVRSASAPVMAQPLEPRMLFTVATSATLPAATVTPIAGAQTVDLDSYFTGAALADNTYDFNTTLGTIPVQLTPGVTPLTVANFLSYLNAGAYTDTVIHRLASGFVWQTGEYKFDSGSNTFTTTPVNAGVQNEPGQSNVEGTIAVAKLSGNANSGTDGFFFNLADNSQNLDSQNGGFTVFGHVLGSAGLSVMESIGNETTIDDGGDFSTLPVQNASAGVTQNNLLFINNIVPVTDQYSVTSDNPGVVTASVSNNVLTFTPQKAGTANLTVDALDADGDVVTQTFAVNVAVPTQGVALGTGSGVNTIVYTDTKKVTTRVSLSNGAATLTFEGYSLAAVQKGSTETITSQGGATLDSIKLITSTRSSVLSINAPKAGATVGEIDADLPLNSTPLRSIVAPNITLTGTSTFYSGIVTSSFASIAAGATFNAYAVGKISISGVLAGELECGSTIEQVNLKSALTGSVQSGSMEKFFGHDVSGTFSFTQGIGILQIAGTFSGIVSAEYIDKASITKMSSATIELSGSNLDLGTLKTQTMAGSMLESVGSLGTIVIAQPITASQILAGVDPTSQTAETAADVAAGSSSSEIVSLKIGGSKTANSFADSSIGAAELRSVSIGNIVDTASMAAFYGIAAQRILSLTTRVGSLPLKLINVASEDVLKTRLAAQKISPTNVTLEIVTPTSST